MLHTNISLPVYKRRNRWFNLKISLNTCYINTHLMMKLDYVHY